MKPNFVILYVQDPQASAAFYEKLLQKPVIESSPGFAMLPFNGETMLGLWRREAVLPAVSALAGGSELAISVDSKTAVDALYAAWKEKGVTIAQPPSDMDFGRTFTAIDSDNHRIRVLCAT